MDDFERGAREMQRVAAEAIDKIAAQTEETLRFISKGFDHAHTRKRLNERHELLKEVVAGIRTIKIQDAVDVK